MVSRYSLGINYNGAQINLNHYGGENAQFTWALGYNNGVFSAIIENDAFLNVVNKNGSDKFRTAAIEFGFGYLRAGFSIYTNNPMEQIGQDEIINKEQNQWVSKYHRSNKLGSGSYNYGKRIFSNIYFGFNNGLTISRIGVDAPGIQDFIQNGWHQSRAFGLLSNGKGSPYIPTNYSQPVIPYFYGGYAFPTLY